MCLCVCLSPVLCFIASFSQLLTDLFFSFFFPSSILEVAQWSPTFLAPGTRFVKDIFSRHQGCGGGGDGFTMIQIHTRASLVPQTVKNLPAMQETLVPSLGWEDSPGEGNGNPLQCSCLENPMDRGAWRATV